MQSQSFAAQYSIVIQDRRRKIERLSKSLSDVLIQAQSKLQKFCWGLPINMSSRAFICAFHFDSTCISGSWIMEWDEVCHRRNEEYAEVEGISYQ